MIGPDDDEPYYPEDDGAPVPEDDDLDEADEDGDEADFEAEADDEDARRDSEDFLIDGVGFADPGGRSALRAATPDNPRNLSCRSCGAKNVLTPADRAAGYCCDRCADQAERGGY